MLISVLKKNYINWNMIVYLVKGIENRVYCCLRVLWGRVVIEFSFGYIMGKYRLMNIL